MGLQTESWDWYDDQEHPRMVWLLLECREIDSWCPAGRQL